MRIGWVVYGPLDRRSGGYLYDAEVVERLRAGGDEVTVCSLPERPYPGRLLHNVSPVVRRRLRALEAEVDVVVQDELCHPSLAWANGGVRASVAESKSARDAPPVVSLVHHLRSDEPRPPWRGVVERAVERRYLRSVDGVVCASESTRQSVAALTGIDPEPSVVAHPGADRFSDRPHPDDDAIRRRAREGPFRVVFVGSVTPRKGLHTLVRALVRLRQEWTLTVVGDVDVDRGYVRRVESLVAELGATERVTFTGRVDDEALAEALSESHVLAMPSVHEGFGIVYVEGMGYGLPAVASTAGGADEVVVHGENGALVDPGDTSALVDVFSPLARDRERLGELGVAARRTSERHPTWDDTARRVRDFLAGIARGTPAAASPPEGGAGQRAP